MSFSAPRAFLMLCWVLPPTAMLLHWSFWEKAVQVPTDYWKNSVRYHQRGNSYLLKYHLVKAMKVSSGEVHFWFTWLVLLVGDTTKCIESNWSMHLICFWRRMNDPLNGEFPHFEQSCACKCYMNQKGIMNSIQSTWFGSIWNKQDKSITLMM